MGLFFLLGTLNLWLVTGDLVSLYWLTYIAPFGPMAPAALFQSPTAALQATAGLQATAALQATPASLWWLATAAVLYGY